MFESRISNTPFSGVFSLAFSSLYYHAVVTRGPPSRLRKMEDVAKDAGLWPNAQDMDMLLPPPRACSPPPLVPAPTRLATPWLHKVEDVADDELGFGLMHKICSPPLTPTSPRHGAQPRHRQPTAPPQHSTQDLDRRPITTPPQQGAQPQHGAHNPATANPPRHPNTARKTSTADLSPHRPNKARNTPARNLNTARTTPPPADTPPRWPNTARQDPTTADPPRRPNAACDHNEDDAGGSGGRVTLSTYNVHTYNVT
ncbi:hypothetical protein EDB85DRAFT_1890664 [Lactarius pseudohatsudake]|nr:hypothetical protein EDB85DRAFT_1890664 [Lactarius pseudohatsudake]